MNQKIVSWRGIAFENVCFNHIKQIKSALEIGGISSEESAWSKLQDEDGAQIDMIIKRKDNTINICEIKFYGSEFLVDKNLDKKIRFRASLIKKEVPKRYSIRNTLITTFGIIPNEYSNVFTNVISLDDLFAI